MNTFNRVIGIIITILMSIIVFFLGVKDKDEGNPLKLFSVYLNGEKIGLIENKEELLNLIDKEQIEIKEKYGVDKVYPPSGLDIQSIVTYDDDIISVNKVYSNIKDKEPFTISGYQVVINYDYLLEEAKDDEKMDTTIELKEPVVLNVLNKEDFETGLYNTAAAFIGSENLKRYDEDTQLEIIDVGSTIENVYWKEDITVKKSYLSTEEFIYTNSSDISKYLLFGTLEDGKKYKVKEGDDIASVAEANNLNVDEFLVANPNFTSSNVLLTAGQIVNTALISPVVSIVYEVEKVEDVEVPYETEYRDDDSKYVGDNTTIQVGENGISRITESIQYVNGEIQGLIITNTSDISPAINKIVSKGTKQYSSGGTGGFIDVDLSIGDWVWPTVRPFVITSYYGWRWGRLHGGIDISGTGFGSPIYSSTDGVVVRINTSCANRGYYGSPCGGGHGNYAYIQTDSGYLIYYSHMTNNIPVSVGQRVSKGQIIGYMGDSGSSTGTHLHYQIEDASGNRLNPCKVAFKC